MSHLEADRLTLLALGDDPGDGREAVHLADCPGCREQLDDLRAVAVLGAEIHDIRGLPPAPERIWRSVQAAVGPAVPPVPATAAPRWRPKARAGALAAAAVVLVIAGVVVARTDQPRVEARARLDRLAAAPIGARGTARIVDRTVRLHVAGMPMPAGYYEVWLLDPGSGGMIALGDLGTGADATFALPPNADLREYRVVDVSAEPYDGNPAHSGRSMLRGALT